MVGESSSLLLDSKAQLSPSVRVEARHGPLRVRSSPLIMHVLSLKVVHPNVCVCVCVCA